MTALRFAPPLIALGLALVASTAQAEVPKEPVSDSPIVAQKGVPYVFAPDRPGFGDATSVVPQWRFALETGTHLSSAAADATFGFEGLLVRMGVLSWLELRFHGGGLTHGFGQGGVNQAPGGAGFKAAFGLMDGLDVALVTTFGIPQTEEALAEDPFQVSSGLNVEFALSDTAGLAVTGVVDVTEERWEAGGALGLIRTLDDASLYIEGAVLTDDRAATTIQFGVGATRMLTDSLQVDLFMDYALPESGTIVLIGLGAAYLI